MCAASALEVEEEFDTAQIRLILEALAEEGDL